jgi:hypothetical protein
LDAPLTGSPADALILWSVRLSLACYLAALSIRLLGRGSPRTMRLARAIWTAGYLLFLVHLFAAFQFVHHWNHAAAYEVTARRTAETVGTPFGAGIYVNHLFLIVWGLDVLWWQLWPEAYLRRSRLAEGLIQGFLAFIAFNSTVVFGRGLIRIWGAAGTGLLAAIAITASIRGSRAREMR